MASNQIRMSMLTVLLPILFCLRAVDSQAQDQKSVSALVDGRWALQFQINQNFDLSSFEGSTFSVKKFTGEQSAWRLGVGMSASFRDRDRSGYADTMSLPVHSYDYDSCSIAAVMHRILYSAPRSRTSLFFGFGPALGYSHSKTSERFDDAGIRKIKVLSWDIGLSAAVGVEWFLRRNISLLAEYSTVMKYEYQKQTDETVFFEESTTMTHYHEIRSDGFVFDDQAVKFGLSVYF